MSNLEQVWNASCRGTDSSFEKGMSFRVLEAGIARGMLVAQVAQQR
jgi:hypothetical protein